MSDNQGLFLEPPWLCYLIFRPIFCADSAPSILHYIHYLCECLRDYFMGSSFYNIAIVWVNAVLMCLGI